LFEASGTQNDPPEKISTQNRRPHIAMSFNLTIAWKASPTRTPPPICTSAPGPQTALVWRAAGAASILRDTAWLVSRNGNDSRHVPAKSTSQPQNRAAVAARGGKVLNLCKDSKCRSDVRFVALPKINSQIGYVRAGWKSFFEQPNATMPISDYASAFFFVRRNRVTLQARQIMRDGRDCTFKTVRD
jgi:hypothetical protein